MPFAAAIPAIISGVSALAGLFGGGKAKQEVNTTSDSTQNLNQTNSTTPNFTPEQQALIQFLIPNLMQRANGSGIDSIVNASVGQGLRAINQGSDVRKRLLQNMAISRGMQYSPAGLTPQIQNEDARIGETVNLLSQVPQMRDSLQRQRLSDVLQMFTSLPTGQTQHLTGTNTMHTTGKQEGWSQQPGGMVGGLVSGLGQGLASTYGYQWGLQQQAANNPKTQG